MTTNIPLNGARLWDSLMEIAQIGGTAKGGCNRQTLTDLDADGRALFQSWGEAVGLTLSVDRVGNMVFRRPGRDPSRKPIAIGSHLDTQPTGGKFDGILGVLAGLEKGEAAAAAEYGRLLARTVRPELVWSNRLRWLLFRAMRHFGAGPVRGFVQSAPAALAQMVHGRRSFKLLQSKTWEWGAGVGG